MEHKNFKSDFDFVIRLISEDADGQKIAMPWPECDWSALFWTSNKANTYTASYVGGEYTNCFREADGGMHFVFDNHKMGTDVLKWELHLRLPNRIYPDAIQDIFCNGDLDIELISGTGVGSENVVLEVHLPIGTPAQTFMGMDLPLLHLLRESKKINVDDIEIEVDVKGVQSPARSVTTIGIIGGETKKGFLPLDDEDKGVIDAGMTLLLPSVNGYDTNGIAQTGDGLMLYVSEINSTNGLPVVHAVNGYKDNISDEESKFPTIPPGTKCFLLSGGNTSEGTARNELQMVYLQNLERGESEDIDKAIKASRTIWAGRMGKIYLTDNNGDDATSLHFMQGLRWQLGQEVVKSGKWDILAITALMQMFFEGPSHPVRPILFAGGGLMAQLSENVTNGLICSVFGNVEVRYEPTLDELGWGCSGAILDAHKLHYYVCNRDGVRHEAVVLTGGDGIWIDGDRDISTESTTRPRTEIWDSATAPEGYENMRYYLLHDCPDIDMTARAGQTWMLLGELWRRV